MIVTNDEMLFRWILSENHSLEEIIDISNQFDDEMKIEFMNYHLFGRKKRG